MKEAEICQREFPEGRRISGYRVIRCAALQRIEAAVVELLHEATGARHLHIAGSDRENTFGVAFKTVPRDSTGVAHILEHTVLCGSRRFPVRDPFFSMLKRSLSTFMNAFTAPDSTFYPFATQNRKDFYNLMDVYLDAVFYPRLDTLSFKQEGHRLEIEEESGKKNGFTLRFKGVVYNEMRGAMSSPDQVMVRSILNALYPSTTYRHNSGGDPLVIPDLTYEQLKQFHQRHYHPSNAFFYTYGNLPLSGHLAFIAETVLSRFGRIDPETDIPCQVRWDRPRKARYFYPLDPGEDSSKRSQACVAWLAADVRNSLDVLTLTLLEQILLGNAASPVRKALMDSRLGSALSDGTGFEPDYRDALFACGLKDIKEKHALDVEALVLKTLKGLADGGIDKEIVDSALHQLEFHRKEITHHPYPYGIKLLMASLGAWIHGGDPFARLKFEADLEKILTAREKGPFFEEAIRRFFLENPHRLLLTLSPDPKLEEKSALQIRDKLETLQKTLTDAAAEAIRTDARALRKLQDSQEPVTVLPTLEIADIPPQVVRVSPSAFDKAPAVCFDSATSGIFYWTSAAGIDGLDAETLPLVPFFCWALSRIGTRLNDFAAMAKRIDRWAGGIGFSASVRTRFDASGESMPYVLLNAKCLNRNQRQMLEILEELFSEFDVSDLPRLGTLLDEYKARLETGVVNNGHRLAISLASRNLSPAAALDETWHGVSQLRTVKALTTGNGRENLQPLAQRLAAIGKHVFRTGNLKCAFIGDATALLKAVECMEKTPFLSRLADSGGVTLPPIPLKQKEDGDIREGWSTASAVSFVAEAFKTVRMIHEDAPALAVIAKLLRSLYLHREIREKGGAYGAFAVYNSETGLFSLGSYRDPHIVKTLGVFNKAAQFICSGTYEGTDVKEAILQVCSDIDRPDPPGPAERKAFLRSLIHLSDDDRQRFKETLLSLDLDRVLAVARRYFAAKPASYGVAVISGEGPLKDANAHLDPPLALKRI